MKTGPIASNLVALSLGAFLSACGGAEMTDGSDLSADNLAAEELSSNFEQAGNEVTACDDAQYDHWRYLSALAVASANELGRWNAARDFTREATNNNPRILLSSEGLARCTNGCENIQAILQLQNTETSVIPRHDPLLLRQYMRTYFERQVNHNINNAVANHTLTLAAVSPDICGLRYHYNVTGGSSSTTTGTFSGTSEFRAASSNKCMDVVGVSSNDGAQVQQFSCSNGSNQKFTVESVGNNNYRLKAAHSGKCLGVVNNGTGDGSLLEQRSCGANNSQLFQLNSKGTNVFELRNVNSGKCVDIQGGGTADGQRAVLFSCHGGSNQRFQASGVSGGGGTSSSSSVVTSSLWGQLKFAGESDNRYLMFQSTPTQVSIDPMGTMVDGGSSASSGACVEGGTMYSSTNVAGSCCSVNGKYGTLQRSAFNAKTYVCKI
jgi:hypothetical protein